MPISTDIKQIQEWLERYHAMSAEASRLDHAYYNESPTPWEVKDLEGKIATLEGELLGLSAADPKRGTLQKEIADKKADVAAWKKDLETNWKVLQDEREKINVLSDSIRESLYLLNEQGKKDFLALQPSERENTGKSAEMGKVVTQGGWDKYYRDAALGAFDPKRGSLPDSSPFVSGGGGGYSFITGKSELSTLRAPMNAGDLINKLGLQTYNGYYREIPYKDPASGAGSTKKWPHDLVGVTWNLVESEMYKVRSTTDGSLIQLVRDLPKTAEKATQLLKKTYAEMDLDKNWWPVEKEGVGGLTRGGGREWLYDTGSGIKLKRAHGLETYRYPAPALPADPGYDDAKSALDQETKANELRLEKTNTLVREYPGTLADAAKLVGQMTDDKRDKLKSADQKTKFNFVRDALRKEVDAAKVSGDKLRAELAKTPDAATRDAWAKSLDSLTTHHESLMNGLESRMLEARQLLAAVPGELAAEAGAGAPGTLSTGAPTKLAGEAGKAVSNLRVLVKQFKDSYGRTPPPGYEAAVNAYNDWLAKKTPEGLPYVPDPVRKEISAELADLNLFIDAHKACKELETLAVAFEKSGKIPGGWSNALWAFETAVKGGRVPTVEEARLRDLVARADTAHKAAAGPGAIPASLLLIHEDMLEVSGKAVRIRGTGTTVFTGRTAETGRDVTEVGVTKGAVPAEMADKKKSLPSSLRLVDVEAGHGSVALVQVENLGDGVKNVLIGAGSVGADKPPADDLTKTAKRLDVIILDHFHNDHINEIENVLYHPDDRSNPTITVASEFTYYKKIGKFVVPHATNIPPTLLGWTEKMVNQATRLGATIHRLAHLEPDSKRDLGKDASFVGQQIVCDGFTIFAFHDREACRRYDEARAAVLGDTGTEFDDFEAGMGMKKAEGIPAGYRAGKSKYVVQAAPGEDRAQGALEPTTKTGRPHGTTDEGASWTEVLASGAHRHAVGLHHSYVEKFKTELTNDKRIVPRQSIPGEIGPGLNPIASAYVVLDAAGTSAVIVAHDLPVKNLAAVASDIDRSGVFKKVEHLIWKGAHHGGSLKVDSEAESADFERWCAFLKAHSVGLAGGAIVVISAPKDAWNKGTLHAMRTHGFPVIITDRTSGSRVIRMEDKGEVTYDIEGAKTDKGDILGPVEVKPPIKDFRARFALFDGWRKGAPEVLKPKVEALWKEFLALNDKITDLSGIRDTRKEAEKKVEAAHEGLSNPALLEECTKLVGRYDALEKELEKIEAESVAGAKERIVLPGTVLKLEPDLKTAKLGGKVLPIRRADAARTVPVVIGPKSAPVPAGWEEKVASGEAKLPLMITSSDLERGELKAEYDEKLKEVEKDPKADEKKKDETEAAKLAADFEAAFKPWSESAKNVPEGPSSKVSAFDMAADSKVLADADVARLKGYLKKAAHLTVDALTNALNATIASGKPGSSDEGAIYMGYNALRGEGYITEGQARELTELKYRANTKMALGRDPGPEEARKAVDSGDLKDDLAYFKHMGEDKGALTDGPVDVNTATAYQICAGLRVSASLAENIVATRKKIGGFKTADDLLKVKGMDAKTVSRITPLITISPMKGDEKAPGAGDEKEEKKDEKKNSVHDFAAGLVAKHTAFFEGLPGTKTLPSAELARGVKTIGKAAFESFLSSVAPGAYPEIATLLGRLQKDAGAIVTALETAIAVHGIFAAWSAMPAGLDVSKYAAALKSAQSLISEVSPALTILKSYGVYDKLPEATRKALEKAKGEADSAANLAGAQKIIAFIQDFAKLLEQIANGDLKKLPPGELFARFKEVGDNAFDTLAVTMETPAMKDFLATRPGLEATLKKILPLRRKVMATMGLGVAIYDVYPKVSQFIDDIQHDKISSPVELAKRVLDLGSAVVSKFDVLVEALDAFGLATPKVKGILARVEQVMGTVKMVMGFVDLFDKYKAFYEGLVGGKPGAGVKWPTLDEFISLIDETQKAVDALFADKLLQDYVFKKYPQVENIYKQISSKKEVFVGSLRQAQEVLALYKRYEELYHRIEKAGISDIAPIFFDVLGAAADTIDQLNSTLDLVEQWGIQLPPSVKAIARQLQDPRLQEAMKHMRTVLRIMRKYQEVFQGRTVPLEIKDVMRDILGAAEAGIRGFNAIMQYPSVKGYFDNSPAPVRKAIKFVTQDPGLQLIDFLGKVLDTVQEAQNLYDDLFNSNKDMDFGEIASRLGTLLGKGISTFDDAIRIASKYEDRLPMPVQKMLKRLQKFSIVRLIKIGGMVGDLVNKVRGYWDKLGNGSLGWVKGIVEFAKLMPSLVGDAFKIGKEVVLFLKDIGVASPKMWARIMKIPGVKKIAAVFKKVAGAVKGAKIIKTLQGIGKKLHLDKIAWILLENIEVIEQFMEGGMSIEQAIGAAIEKAIKGMVMTAGSFVGGLAGRALGTAVGSAVGSVIPVIGTTVLGWVGGWLGDMLGSYLGGMLAEKIWNAFVGDGAIAGAAGGMLSGLKAKVKDALPSWLFMIVDTIVSKVSGFISMIFGFIKRAVGLLIDIIDNLADMLTMVKNAALKFFEQVCAWLEPIGRWIKEMWDKYNPVALVKNGVKAIGRGVKKVWNSIFGAEKDGMETGGIAARMGRLMNLATEEGVGIGTILEEYGHTSGMPNYLALVSFRSSAPGETRIVEDQHGQPLLSGVDSSKKFYQMADPRPRNVGARGDESGDPVEYVYVAWDAEGAETPGAQLSYGWIKKHNATIWPKPNTKFAAGSMSWWAGFAMSMVDGGAEPVRAKTKGGGVGAERSVYGVDALPSGTALAPDVQSEMSGVLGGVGLGDVRIHSGAMGAGIAQKFNADAVTIGKDIFFGAGKYDTSSPEGKALIGHELTHVMQDHGAGSHHDHESEALGAEGALRSHFRSKKDGARLGMTHLKDGAGMRTAAGTKTPHAAHTKRQLSPSQGHGPQFDMELHDKILQEVMKLAERERFESRERYGLWR